MTVQAINERLAAIDARYAAIVSAKLGGVSVRVLRHDVDTRTGASIPVFAVPTHCVDAGTRLGLRCEAHVVPPYAVRKRLREATLKIGRETS